MKQFRNQQGLQKHSYRTRKKLIKKLLFCICYTSRRHHSNGQLFLSSVKWGHRKIKELLLHKSRKVNRKRLVSENTSLSRRQFCASVDSWSWSCPEMNLQSHRKLKIAPRKLFQWTTTLPNHWWLLEMYYHRHCFRCFLGCTLTHLEDFPSVASDPKFYFLFCRIFHVEKAELVKIVFVCFGILVPTTTVVVVSVVR